jgi:hypothetical protein
MVFKTKLKRYELGTNYLLVALMAVTAAVQLLGAYGAACIPWGTAITRPPYSMIFGHVADNLLLYQVSNAVSWVTAFLWGFVIYSYLTNRKWAYLSAVVTSALGFVFGIIPAWTSDTKAGTVEFTGMGSPHWGRTMANLVVLVLLILYLVASIIVDSMKGEGMVGTKRVITSPFGTRIAKTVTTQLFVMSVFFIWFSFVSFLGTEFMAGAHVVGGINVWQLIEIQSIGGYVTAIAGSTFLAGGLITKYIKPSAAITTTSL